MCTQYFSFAFFFPSIFVQLPQLIKSPSIYLLCARVLKSATTHESRPIRFLPAVLIEGARCGLINYGDVETTSGTKRLREGRLLSGARGARGAAGWMRLKRSPGGRTWTSRHDQTCSISSPFTRPPR